MRFSGANSMTGPLSFPADTSTVRRERRGAFVHYSLDPDGLDRYGAALKSALGNVFVTAE